MNQSVVARLEGGCLIRWSCGCGQSLCSVFDANLQTEEFVISDVVCPRCGQRWTCHAHLLHLEDPTTLGLRVAEQVESWIARMNAKFRITAIPHPPTPPTSQGETEPR